jgi:ATP-dependent Clp protease ATP-binding subunit ClpA
MSHIEKSVYVDKALSFAQGLAFRYRHEFITPEHILSALFNQDTFDECRICFGHAAASPGQ